MLKLSQGLNVCELSLRKHSKEAQRSIVSICCFFLRIGTNKDSMKVILFNFLCLWMSFFFFYFLFIFLYILEQKSHPPWMLKNCLKCQKKKRHFWDYLWEFITGAEGKCESFLRIIYLGYPQGKPFTKYLITTFVAWWAVSAASLAILPDDRFLRLSSLLFCVVWFGGW